MKNEVMNYRFSNGLTYVHIFICASDGLTLRYSVD